MGSCRFYTFTFIILSVICYSTAFRSKSLRKPSNNNEDNEQISILPKIDASLLQPNDKIIIRKLTAFAIKFVKRAYRVAKMSADKKSKWSRRLEKDYNKEYKNIEPAMAALENRCYDESIRSRLRMFLDALRMLNEKIYCILYGCDMPTPTIATTDTYETTTESVASEYSSEEK